MVDSDWGGGARDVKIKCKITVKGDEVTVDFTGTDPQAPGPINATEAITLSWVYTGFSAVCPDDPLNQGLFRPVRQIILPKGTVVNPNHPAPTGQGTVCCGNSICEAVTDALSKIVPEKIATAGLNLCFLYTWGIDARYDTFFLGLDYIASSMGSGGAHGVDGWGGYPSTLSRLAIPTFEMSEIQFPFLYLEGEYATDTAAPGQWRGVPAFRMQRQTRDVKGNAVVNIFVQGYRHSLTGYVGGKPGAGNYYVLDYGTDKERLITEFDDRPLSSPGQVIFAQSGGGGGWGDPLERDPKMVLSDVVNEYVSLDGAKRDYGVVIDPVRMTVNELATKELRATKRRQ
jgi:N-methylhydantoinase B